MHKIILFRGGMVGDLIIKLIDPRYNVHRTKMKKFFNYTLAQKEIYFNRYNKLDRTCYTLSHDTKFAIRKSPIQIICSDYNKLNWISTRFYRIHRDVVINEVKVALNCTDETFIYTYTKSLKDWQEYHILENRFDIKNIGTSLFLDDVCNYFNIDKDDRVITIYNKWTQNNDT